MHKRRGSAAAPIPWSGRVSWCWVAPESWGPPDQTAVRRFQTGRRFVYHETPARRDPMRPAPRRGIRPVPSSGLLGLAVALAMAASSCGRHALTAPTAHPHLANSTQVGGGSNDADGEVMVTLAPGVDPVAFGQEYGAQMDETNESGAATYRPSSNESPDS